MRLQMLWAALSLMLTFTATQAAAERLTLRMYDQRFSVGETIDLKREAQRQYPRMRLDNYDLNSVNMVAKIRDTQGEVELIAGRYVQDWSRISGRPIDWNNNDWRSWERFNLINRGESFGEWEVRFQSRDRRNEFKVQEITLDVTRRRGGGGGGWEPPRRGYSVIFCIAPNCIGWDRFGRGSQSSPAVEWNFSGEVRRDIQECSILMTEFRSRPGGHGGMASAHMMSDGFYNPISGVESLGRMEIESYCRAVVARNSR